MKPARPRTPFGPRSWSKLTPAVTWLIAINVATFLVFAFSGESARTLLGRWLVLTPHSLLEGHVWKLVTTTFFTISPFAFILDVVVLWLFMPFLEREWGARRFLTFAAATSIIGNLAGAGVGLLLSGVGAARGAASMTPIAGLAPFVYGAMIGYGVAYGDRPVQFFGVLPMKGRTLAIGIAVVVLIAAVVNGDWVLGATNLAGMATAFFMTAGIQFAPRLWILRWRRARLRKRFSVIGGDRPGKKQWLN